MIFKRSLTWALSLLAMTFATLVFTASAASSPKEAAAAGDAVAGKALFTGKLGCYGCHGQAGGGGMGPSLADKTWIYGGDAASISETIHNGRPGGMPAFGSNASEEEIADVVAYVTSLSKK